MIGIHGIGNLKANISTAVDSNWVSIVLTATDGTITEMTLYFATRRRGFEEEHRYAQQLAAAINSVKPMDIGNWGDPEPAVEVVSEGASDLSPREQAAEAGF